MRNAHTHKNILIAYIFRILDESLFLMECTAQHACRWSPMIKLQRWKMKRKEMLKHVVVKNFSNRTVAPGCFSLMLLLLLLLLPFVLSPLDRFRFFFNKSVRTVLLLLHLFHHVEHNQNGVDGCGDVAVSVHICLMFAAFFYSSLHWVWQSHWTCTHSISFHVYLFPSPSLLLSISLSLSIVFRTSWFGPFKFMWFLWILRMLIKIFFHIFCCCLHTFSLFFSSPKHHSKKRKREQHNQAATTYERKCFWEE